MGLISKTVKVKWNRVTRKYYEEFGYSFTKYGDEFEVKTEHLPKHSKIKILYSCDDCGEIKEIMYRDYTRMKRYDGKEYCNKCVRKHMKRKKKKVKQHTNQKSKRQIKYDPNNSVAQYILDNFPNKDLYDVWDKEKNGDLSPWNITKGSNKKIWIKCQEKDYHDSYNPTVINFTHGSRCPYCTNKKGRVHPLDSFGQYIVSNYGEDFLNKIWSDKNDKSPFEYAKGSNIEVWWKSLDGSAEDFKRGIYNSIAYGFRNPRVLNRLTTKEAINLTQEQMDKGFNIGDNYREFVKKCIERALGYYKKDCMGIYKIHNTINNKVYIGQAINIEDRWVEHIYSSLSKNRDEYNYPLYNAFRKYGIGNFNFEILEECNTEELDEKEIYYIKLYNSNIHNQNSHGYNQTDGGYAIRGWKMPEEQRKKQSETMKEKYKNGDYDHFKKTVVCDNKEFKSIKECAEYYNIKYNTMIGWLSHTNDIPQEWYDKGLRYKGETMEGYKISEVVIRRVVCEGITYENITECARHYNIDSHRLSKYLNKTYHMPEIWYNRGLHFEGESMEDYKMHYEYKLGSHPCAKKVVCDGRVFGCISECADFYKVKYETMRGWLNHSNRMPQEWYNKGLHVEGVSMDEYTVQKDNKTGKDNPNSKPVICDGIEFSTLSECANYYNEKASNMTRWINGTRNMPQKFYIMKLRYKGAVFEECNYKVSCSYKKVVICEDKEFSSADECAKYYKVKYGTMKDWLNHNTKMPKEFYDLGLHYKDEPMENYEYSTKNTSVICDGVVFETIRKCAEHYNIKQTTMQYWLNGKHTMPQGFVNKGLKYYKNKEE